MAAVSAKGFGWKHAGRRRAALTDVTFDVAPGEKVLLLGPSGAGKSTLLAAIAGVLGDGEDGERTGSITVGGREAHPGLVGMVLQDPDSQVISARVGDDVAFGAENLGVERDEIWRRVRRALDLVSLDVPLDHPTSQLSGGQKQRLALAGVLAMGARVICLDEPTANIDPEGVGALRDAAVRAAEATGATLLVVEHRVDAWVGHVDRVLVIDAADAPDPAQSAPPGSTVVADGDPDSVIAARGDALRDAGVWIPGPPPVVGTRKDVAPGTAAAFALDGLAVGYGGAPGKARWWRRRDRGDARPLVAPVRERIDAVIPQGASTCVTGPNGSGKSTLALTLGGLLQPMAGRVAVSAGLADGAGPDPHGWSSAQLATRIGNVFQAPEQQFVTSTVRGELELGPKLVGDAAGAERAGELLERLRLGHLAEANPYTLSGGEKRRLSVATVLSTTPSAVILDEPTFGQDRRTFTELVALLRALADGGATVVSVTHDPLVVDALGDAVLDLGALGRPGEVAA